MIFVLLAACGSSDIRKPTPPSARDICLTIDDPEACYQMAVESKGDTSLAFIGLGVACRAGFKDSCSLVPELLGSEDSIDDAVSVVFSPCLKAKRKDACRVYLDLLEAHPKYATEKLLSRAKAVIEENP